MSWTSLSIAIFGGLLLYIGFAWCVAQALRDIRRRQTRRAAWTRH